MSATPHVPAQRVAVVGSRKFPDLAMVRDYVRDLPAGTVVISGGAMGVDNTAECTALDVGLECLSYRPKYQDEGKRAPLIRNQRIVDNCDRLVAFWDGKSRGTMHTVGLARKARKPVEIIEVRS